jgi:hypothetical protein
MKAILLDMYRFFRYLLHRYIKDGMLCKIRAYDGIEATPLSNESVTFFGYYGVSPDNARGDILFLAVSNEKVRGSLHESARIMLKDRNGMVSELAKTPAWNWQQGCMLNWLGASLDQVIYNDYEESSDRYCARILDVRSGACKTISRPIFHVSDRGDFALSLSFERLAVMRPDYGYFNRAIDEKGLLPEDEDGIWLIDLVKDESRLIISLDQLKNLNYVSSMEGAMHKVNHLEFAPDGKRFMFLHRWKGPMGRFMRLLTANYDGSDLVVLNGDVMTSHSCWLTSKQILSYCEYKGHRGYFAFTDKSSKVELYSKQMPSEDGHPSILNNGMGIVCDTYPGKSRISKLIMVNQETGNKRILLKAYQPFKYAKEMRVDMHPKVGSSGKTIFIESGHTGCRRLYQVKGFR